jgi:hypothetical protein
VGNPCVGDAGSGGGGGACTPACCSSDGGPNTANCGTSPEGYVGTCDLNLTGNVTTPSDPTGILYNACTYESTCTIFAKPCGAGYTCIVESSSGTSKCIIIDEVDGSTGGLGLGVKCPANNACMPEMGCYSFSADASTECAWYCYVSGGTPPFDAGIITTAPGKGGCPSTYTCETDTMLLPPWLGICVPP